MADGPSSNHSAVGTEEAVKAIHTVMVRGGADYRTVVPMLEHLSTDPASANRVHALTASLVLEATSTSNARLMSILVLIRFRLDGRQTAGAEGGGNASERGGGEVAGGEGYEAWLRRVVLEGGDGWLATKKTAKFVLDALQVGFDYPAVHCTANSRGWRNSTKLLAKIDRTFVQTMCFY